MILRVKITIMDPSDGSTTTFQLGLEIATAAWRPNSDQLGRYHEHACRLRRAGLLPRGIGWSWSQADRRRSHDPINTPTVSPDGAKLAYATWEAGAEGRIHFADIDSGAISEVDFAPRSPSTPT